MPRPRPGCSTVAQGAPALTCPTLPLSWPLLLMLLQPLPLLWALPGARHADIADGSIGWCCRARCIQSCNQVVVPHMRLAHPRPCGASPRCRHCHRAAAQRERGSGDGPAASAELCVQLLHTAVLPEYPGGWHAGAVHRCTAVAFPASSGGCSGSGGIAELWASRKGEGRGGRGSGVAGCADGGGGG
jgi:hypothetical protein